ncbi:hypothetical protein EJ02DRAFT_337346 [Clathrospora elynae]|uniref:Uncharacterized protein n=1 Tax=Clathrospora elynae TaxID=706981 RepID=A0A6A5T1C9_9PLEO|nr:hypothetical protein EJ02DRAFT_337346 [Clathrospora elynae]
MAAVQVTAELPVRSAVLKQCTGGLVVRWVTTSESLLLFVFVAALFLVARLILLACQDIVVEDGKGVVLADVVHLLGDFTRMWLKLTINYSL